MLDALRKLLAGAASDEETPSDFIADDKQLAEAALLFHVIAADGIVTDDERQRLSALLSTKYGLSDTETAALVAEAQRADSEAIDLYAFTRTLKRALDADERLALIRHLWEMVYADGELHELEDNIVWRVAELLDIEARDRMQLKRSVRAETGNAD